jgi:hypothetical protein
MAISVEPLSRVLAFNTLMTQGDTREVARQWIDRHVLPHEKIVIHSDFYYGKPGPHADRFTLFGQYPRERLADPFWLIVDEHPAEYFCPTPTKEIQDLIAQRGFLMFEINPFKAATERQVYDQLDAFYAPISGFDGVTLPGPRLKIYRIRGVT